MRKVILLIHTSLDGYASGINGEMYWIKFNEELAEDVGKLTDNADTALYGRITYEMMENYWPTAAESPTATKHDIQHAGWVNDALKIVFSKSMQSATWKNTRIIGNNIFQEITDLKNKPGKNILLIGSISIAHTFMELGLIDEYWVNINPVLLGAGIPLFKDIQDMINLNLIQAKQYDCGVVALQYETKRN